MDQNEIQPPVSDAIETLVRRELGPFGVDRVEAWGTEDHDGDPAIRVLIHYHDASGPDPKVAAAMITKLNDLLYELKERRFGYITHRVPEPARRAGQR